MNREYLRYLFKTGRNTNIFLLIVNLLFTLVFFVNKSAITYSVSLFSILYIVIMMECLILPVYELGIIQNRRSVDMYYSLPIKHRDIIITTVISMVSKIYIVHLFAIIPVFIFQLKHISLYGTLLYLLASLFVIMAITLLSTGIVLKCNSILDSIFIIFGYIAAPLMIYFAIGAFFDTSVAGVYLNTSDLIYSFFMFTSGYDILFAFGNMMFNGTEPSIMIGSFISIFCYFIIGLSYTVYELKNRQPERAEQITDSFSTYPLIIGIITLCLMFITVFENNGFSSTVIYLILIFIFYSIMTFIYRREIHFSKKSMILFAAALCVSYGFVYIADVSDGFGLRYSYRNYENISQFNYYFGVNVCNDDYYRYYSANIYKQPEYNSEVTSLIKDMQEEYVDLDRNSYMSADDSGFINVTFNVRYRNAFFSYYYDDTVYGYTYEDMLDKLEEIEKLENAGIDIEFFNDEGIEMDYSEFKEALLTEFINE